MELEEYAKLIPAAPDDLVDWVQSQGYLNEQWLIYRGGWEYEPLEDRKYPCAKGVCTACGTRFVFEKIDAEAHCARGYRAAPFGILLGNHAVIDGDAELCPTCGAAVKIRHCGNVQQYNDLKYAYPLVISRVREYLVLACWRVSAWPLEKEGRVRYDVRPYDAYVVDRNKIVRVEGYTRNMGGSVCWHGWEARVRYVDLLGSGDLNYPMEDRVADGTFAENAKLDVYIKDAGDKALPVSYLRLYLKHHNVENLVTAGLSRLVTELIRSEAERDNYYNPPQIRVPKLPEIHWKATKPHEMLGMTREQLRMAKEWGWDAQDLRFWESSVRLGAGVRPEEIRMDPLRVRSVLNEEGTLDRLKRQKGLEPAEMVKYLRRQHRRDQRADWHIWRDYLRMAELLEIDLREKSALEPYDLLLFHDRAAAAMQAVRQTERRGDFTAMAELLAPLTWEADGICIRAAASQEELSREGAALQHCVGGYGEQHCSGKCIFFIRHAEKPEKSWYTLNLDLETGKVIQNRGLKNCARTPEVTAFENRWLAEVVAPWMGEQKERWTNHRKEQKRARDAERKRLGQRITEEAKHGQPKGETAA